MKKGTIAKRLYEDIQFFASYGFNKCLGEMEILKLCDGREFSIAELAGENVKGMQLFSLTENQEE
jgi:hypothetical protein